MFPFCSGSCSFWTLPRSAGVSSCAVAWPVFTSAFAQAAASTKVSRGYRRVLSAAKARTMPSWPRSAFWLGQANSSSYAVRARQGWYTFQTALAWASAWPSWKQEDPSNPTSLGLSYVSPSCLPCFQRLFEGCSQSWFSWKPSSFVLDFQQLDEHATPLEQSLSRAFIHDYVCASCVSCLSWVLARHFRLRA